MKIPACLGVLLAACASSPSLTPRELRYAMTPDSWGWSSYASDGTPASDTSAALARTAMWIFEDGADRLGRNVYFTEALRRGVHDWTFHTDACVMVRMRGYTDEYELLQASARRMFPDSSLVCPPPSSPRRRAAP